MRIDDLADGLPPSPSLPREREHVHILIIGHSDLVTRTIHDLYLCQFCEVHVWSRPLPPPLEAIDVSPTAIMRVYKRYLSLSDE